MAELKIPQKTLQDNFNLQDFKDDFNALNSEIEENKTLTDSEISKLKEIANTWEAFKSSGGTIGGDIIIPRGSQIKSQANGIVNALIWQGTEGVDSGAVMVGSTLQRTEIVSEVKPTTWYNGTRKYIIDSSDYVSDKSLNGYTKLPNGLILQWGSISETVSGLSDKITWVQYPIEFPNRVFNVTHSFSCQDSNTNARIGACYSYPNSNSQFKVRWNGLDLPHVHTIANVRFSWLAIGY